MKKYFLLSLLLLASIPAQAQNKSTAAKPATDKKDNIAVEYVPSTLLSQTSFFDGQVKVTYPAAFKQIPLNISETRYPDAANRPKIILAPGDNYNVNLALNLTENDNNDRGSIIKFFRDIKESIRQQYPNDAEFMTNDVDNREQTAVIEVIFPNSQKQKIYNLMYFVYLKNQFFYMNFSCPAEDVEKWQKTAWTIKDSIKISK